MKATLIAYYKEKEDEDEAPLLLLNDEIGEGEVHVASAFTYLPSLQQADLLKDWIAKLEEIYASVKEGDFLADLGASDINGESGGSMH